MAIPNLYLADPQKQLTNIRLDWHTKLNVGTRKKPRIAKARFRYHLSIKVPPKFWIKRRNKVKEVSDFPDGSSINTQLSNIVEGLKSYYNKNLANSTYPTRADLREFLNELTFRLSPTAKKMKREQVDEYKKFKERIDAFCKLFRGKRNPDLIDSEKKKIIKLVKKIDLHGLDFKYKFKAWIATLVFENKITNSSALTYLNRLVTLEAYEEQAKILVLENINLSFLKDFLLFSYYVKDYGQNTIALTIRVLSSFVKWAYFQGLTDNRIWEHPDFVCAPFEPETIALTMDEIWSVIDYDFASVETVMSKKAILNSQEAFAIFFLQGIRYSDRERIKEDNIEHHRGHPYFGVRMQKTQRKNQKAVIPCHWKTLELLEKHGGKMPKFYRHDYLSKAFKEMCFWAGINRIVTVTEMKKNQVIVKEMQAWEAISVHSGRRSYATYLFNEGVDIEAIKAFLGHASTDQTRKYLKIKDIDVAHRAVETGLFRLPHQVAQ